MTKIPFKNYIYLLLVVVVSIGILYYLYLWFIEYDKNKEYKSVLSNVLQVINDNELDSYIVENEDAIIYVGVSNVSKNRQYDKKVKKIIINNNLEKKILFLNSNSDEMLDIKLPAILVYNKGSLVNSYSIVDNNYDIHDMEKFLIDVGVIKDA